MKSLFSLVLISCCYCCSTDSEKILAVNEMAALAISGTAQVTKVSVSGDENAYTFKVTVESPDTGCNQYADWWEVLDLDGNLIHRRILAHSHVGEQPFTRSGTNIELRKDTQVYVRAHMNNSGYGGKVQKGSVENGFTATELDVEFAESLEKEAPLPEGCDF